MLGHFRRAPELFTVRLVTLVPPSTTPTWQSNTRSQSRSITAEMMQQQLGRFPTRTSVKTRRRWVSYLQMGRRLRALTRNSSNCNGSGGLVQ